MLEPNDLPDELRSLEDELSQPVREDISDELRSRVIESVRHTLHAESAQRSVRHRTLVVVGSLVAVAAVVLVLIRGPRPTESEAQRDPPPIAMSQDEEIKSVPLPTVLAYRLSHDDSPDDWQALVERRLDSFTEMDDEQPMAIAWNNRSSLLNSAE